MSTKTLDITVIVLAFNEKLHIQRCLENACSFAKRVCVVDSFSTDDTPALAKAMGAEVFQNKWEKNYAAQFNWALTHIEITTAWILRLDADEYLTQELIDELRSKLSDVNAGVSGIIFNLRRVFCGRWIRHNVSVKLLRLFRTGKGICEQRWMDEHIQLTEGCAIEFEHDFVDHNLNTIGWWTQKHKGYAIREAIDLLAMELGEITEGKQQGKSAEMI